MTTKPRLPATENDKFMEWQMLDGITITPPDGNWRNSFLVGVYMDSASVIFRWTQERLTLEVARGNFRVIGKSRRCREICRHIEKECQLRLGGTSPHPERGTETLRVTCGCSGEDRGHSFDIMVVAPRYYEADGTDVTPPRGGDHPGD
jgi:hypothetical protein